MSDRRTTGTGQVPARGREQHHRGDDGTASAWAGLREKWRRLLASPQLDYKVILVVTGILVALGLIVALSSSMVTSRTVEGGTVFSEFLKQAQMVIIGLLAMWFALWIRPARVRELAPVLLLVAVFLLVLVLFFGVGDDIGSKSWLSLGPVTFQPSELAKLALAVWGSAAVAVHTRRSPDVRGGLSALLLVFPVIVVLVIAQKDLGMTMSLGMVGLTLLLFSGVSGRLFGVVTGVLAVLAALSITSLGYRSDRIATWIDTVQLNLDGASGQDTAYQARQGLYSLSDGGMFGQGLGQSRAKWDYLPEATNDYVFAIIGEELGIVGAGIVILLFALLGWFGIRTATRQTDPFLRLLAATLTVSVVGQAFYNIGYVVGLVPVTGVQLPLLSAGGTSAVITLTTLGLLASCARHEPETVSSMQHEGRPLIDRILMLREPTVHISGADHRERVRARPRRYGDTVTNRPVPLSGDPDARRRDAGGYRGTTQRNDLRDPRSRSGQPYRSDESRSGDPRRRSRP